MTTIALIAAACIWFAAGYITAELVRTAKRLINMSRAESTLADGDELLCRSCQWQLHGVPTGDSSNATVFRERTGEIAWWDNDKPPEYYGGDTVT